jgi:hypothetical protein
VVKRFLAPLALLIPVVAAASILDRVYDFTDDYYRANGVDPTKINGRRQAPSAQAVVDTPNFSYQRNVRMISTTAGYGASGSPQFFVVLGGNSADLFTNDAAGRKARQIADSYAEYIFPQRGANPVGIPNGRQSFVHQNNNGYFSNNPLGLWIHVWVNFTDKAFNTADGKKALADLASKNGLALDGTPIIKTTSEIDNLYSKGYVTKLTTNDASRYAICPEIKDPRDGGIAPDAYANFIKRPDGSYLEPELVEAWNSLKSSGNWPKG